MKLRDFLTSTIEEAISERWERPTLSDLPKEASRIFKANHVVPEHTLIRFDSSLVRDGDFRYHHFNLLLKMTPEHPYFRPYLKSWVTRQTCSLCLFESPLELSTFSYCQYGAEMELKTIVSNTEQCIIERVMQFDGYIHTVNEIAAQHGLSPESMSQLFKSMDYLVKHSPYDRDYLLCEENRNDFLVNRGTTCYKLSQN